MYVQSRLEQDYFIYLKMNTRKKRVSHEIFEQFSEAIGAIDR